MNEKIQAILLKLVIELKKSNWTAGKDWELTLKSEGHIPMVKQISVEGTMNRKEWNDNIETMMDLKLASNDEITYFPEYNLYANILIQGGASKDIVAKLSADVAFTASDVRDDKKISQAANRINRLVEDQIEHEYTEYLDNNADELKAYSQGGWKADDDFQRGDR